MLCSSGSLLARCCIRNVGALLLPHLTVPASNLLYCRHLNTYWIRLLLKLSTLPSCTRISTFHFCFQYWIQDQRDAMVSRTRTFFLVLIFPQNLISPWQNICIACTILRPLLSAIYIWIWNKAFSFEYSVVSSLNYLPVALDSSRLNACLIACMAASLHTSLRSEPE